MLKALLLGRAERAHLDVNFDAYEAGWIRDTAADRAKVPDAWDFKNHLFALSGQLPLLDQHYLQVVGNDGIQTRGRHRC